MKTEQGIRSDLDEFADSPLPFLREGSSGVRLDMSFRSDSSSPFDEVGDVGSVAETDEGRLSRALQSWMPDHVLKPLRPREKPPLEPIFSGRLGKERPVLKPNKVTSNPRAKPRRPERRARTAPVRRVPSDESIATNLSLLTCSSIHATPTDSAGPETATQRRRKRKVASRASTQTSGEFVSIWCELSLKSTGILKRLNRNLAMRTDYGLIGGDMDSGESEAFKLFDKDEQKAVFEAGKWCGIKYIDSKNLVRCSSMQNLTQYSKSLKVSNLRRVLSASAKKGFGRPLDIAELKRERLNRLLAAEQARLQLERERRKGRRGALARKASANSLVGSVSQSSPPATAAPSVSAMSAHSSSDHRPASPDTRPAGDKVTVWKGDREILEIDLKKELTQRVKHRITTTRTALKRATGLGDGNEQTKIVGKSEEFPKHIEEDFCHKPKIIQRMRISPHLSDVIHDDIQVRMGRPRYHEIRVSDLEQWNKGQSLDRAHRNLKVFNWLHSLKESEFERDFEAVIVDEVPDVDLDLELLHVESADEPDVKPLYRAYEVRIL